MTEDTFKEHQEQVQLAQVGRYTNSTPPVIGLTALGHYFLGAKQDEWFDVREDAQAEFARQFAEVPVEAGQYLFIRKPAELIEDNPLEGGVRYRMVARFSVMAKEMGVEQMTKDEIPKMAVQAGLRDYVAEFFKSELHTFAKYVEMATLIDIEKRIEELVRRSDPMTQAGAMAVLREMRGEK